MWVVDAVWGQHVKHFIVTSLVRTEWVTMHLVHWVVFIKVNLMAVFMEHSELKLRMEVLMLRVFIKSVMRVYWMMREWDSWSSRVGGWQFSRICR